MVIGSIQHISCIITAVRSQFSWAGEGHGVQNKSFDLVPIECAFSGENRRAELDPVSLWALGSQLFVLPLL